MQRLAIPFFQDKNGILLVKLYVNSIRIHAAIDTGSSTIVLNTTNSSYYPGTAPSVETLRFGTQEHTVAWELCRCTFEGYHAKEARPIQCSGNMYVARVLETWGQTHYSILGLGRPVYSQDTTSVLGIDRFTVERVSSTHGWVIFNSEPSAMLNRVPLMLDPSSPFFKLHAHSVFLGNTPLAYDIGVVFDLGSNYTTFPEQLLRRIQDAWPEAVAPHLRFVFATLELDIGPGVYSTDEKLLLDGSPDSRVIVLGSLLLRCVTIQFGHDYIALALSSEQTGASVAGSHFSKD